MITKNNKQQKLGGFLKKNGFYLFMSFFFLIYCFLILRKIGWNGVINHTDFFYPFNLTENLKNIFSSWNNSSLGYDNTGIFTMSLMGIIVYILQFLFSDEIGSRILFLLPLLFIFIASYKLLDYLIKDSVYKKPAVFLGSYFAICNPAVLNDLFLGTTNILFGLAFIIFAFYLIIKGLEEKKIIYGLYLGVSSIFFSHITSLSLFFIFIFIFLVFFLVFKKERDLKFLLKFFFIAIAISTLLNLYWLIPYATKILGGNFVEETFSGGRDISILQGSSEYARLHSLTRLISYYDIKKMFVFNNNIGIIAGFLLLITTLIPFLKKKVGFYPFFFLFTIVFFLILSLGTRKPFGGMFNFFWDNIPLFHGFRSTRRFLHLVLIGNIALLSFSAVFISGYLEKIFARYKKYKEKALYVFFAAIFLLISFVSWPMFAGNLLGTALPLEIPQEYFEALEYQKKDPSYSKMLILPQGSYPFFTWMQDKSERKLYSNYEERMVDYAFELNFYKKPPVLLFAYSYKPIIDKVYNLIETDFTAFTKIMGFFNIKDILVHKDYYDPSNGKVLDYKKYEKALEGKFKKVKDNSFFSLYSAADTALSKIYVPSQIKTITDKKIDKDFFAILAKIVEKDAGIAFATDKDIKNIPSLKKSLVYPILFDRFDSAKIEKGSIKTSINSQDNALYTIEKTSQKEFYKVFYRFTDKKIEFSLKSTESQIKINESSFDNQSLPPQQFELDIENTIPSILSFQGRRYHLDSTNNDWTELSDGQFDFSNKDDELLFFEKDINNQEFELLNEKNNYNINLRSCSKEPAVFDWNLINLEKREFEVESKKNNACFALNIGQIKKQKIYTFSFDYQLISGTFPNICVSETTTNKCLPLNPSIKNIADGWKSYKNEFYPDQDYIIYPHFYHSPLIDSTKNIPTKIQYRDIKLEEFSLYKILKTKDLFQNEALLEENNKKEYKIILNKGGNNIELLSEDLDGKNMIENGDFEDGGNEKKIEKEWSILHDCSAADSEKPDFYLKKVSDGYQSKNALLIASKKHNACIAPTVEIEPGYKYLFTFNYKVLSGNRPNVNLHESGLNKSAKIVDFPDLEEIEKNRWYYYESLVEPDKEALSILVYFYNFPLANGEETKIIYDNVRFIKIPSSLTSSIFLNSAEEEKINLPSSTNIKRISNTKYKVNILGAKESFPLIFSESFQPYWKLYIKNKDDVSEIMDKNHFQANGFANAWFVDLKDLESSGLAKKNKGGSYDLDLIIEYWPQRLILPAILLSLLTLTAILLFFAATKYLPKKKKSAKKTRKTIKKKVKNKR